MTSPAPFSEEAYLAELEAASNSDLSLVEGRGVVTVYTAADDTDELLQDGDGNFVVTIVPGNVPSDEDAWDKSFQLFLRETTELVKSSYRIVYVHSGCSSPAWFAWWVSQLRARVSRDHRKNLKALSVVHPTFAVRAFFFAARPFVSAKFWEKLHYVDRIDELFLDDIIPKQHVTRVLPVSVVNGEKHMVEEDVEIARQMAIAAGATLTPRQ